MNKSFYFFGLFFLGLATGTQVLLSVLDFRLGFQWIELPSAGGIYLFELIVLSIPSFFLMRYFYEKRYWFTFWSFAVVIVIGLSLGFITFQTVVTKEPNKYLFTLSSLVLAADVGMLPALSFRGPGEMFGCWLQESGCCCAWLSGPRQPFWLCVLTVSMNTCSRRTG
jgi:hypothetical protein